MVNKKVIDKKMIEEFSIECNAERANNACYLLSDYADDIALELSLFNPLININNLELIPAGDYFNNTAISTSELDMYLTVRSAQIELNSIGPLNNRFRQFWTKVKTAWANRNKNTKRAKRKLAKQAKKAKKEITPDLLMEKKEKPYTIYSLKNDFYDKLIERLSNLTILYNQPTKIRLLAKEELGFRINIYPAIKHDDSLKIWDATRNKFIIKKPLEARSLLNTKNNEINSLNERISTKTPKSKTDNSNDILYKVIRIFKNLYYNMNQSYNYEFIESLMYNCPNSLFDKSKSIYEIFIKVLNYLNNTTILNFRSIYDQDKTIYSQYSISSYSVKNFLKEIDTFLI